jgi:ABC-type uncharacterized transport system ATPase subunit
VNDFLRRRKPSRGQVLGAQPNALDDATINFDRLSRKSQASESRETVIELSDISMHFGGIVALQSVSLTCSSGELLGVIGPNGSGKTTLLNVISGAYKPTGGSGVLRGQAIKSLF